MFSVICRPAAQFSSILASFRVLPQSPLAFWASSSASVIGFPIEITLQVIFDRKCFGFSMEINEVLILSILGFILVTLFAVMNCCGLLVLLFMKPIKGTPLHDVTTGIVSALSTLILLLISLGVISSRLCQAPPADNRVNVDVC